MKPLFYAAAAAGMIAAPAFAQPAADRPSAPACINTMRIDHTSVPDRRTILFHMQGGKIWRNALVRDCPDLKTYGFSYSPTSSHQICANLQAIRVIETGTVCMLGAFTPYEPPAGDAAP